MSFQQGLSGLNSSSKALDVVSNNIANANTVGFKSAATHFADVYANSLAGAGASQVGIGVQTAAIMQQFTQGNITTTNNPLDISINGGGFYRMSSGEGSITYSRNGQFHLDKEGYIVDDRLRRLTGNQYANGVSTGSLGDINVSSSLIAPKISSKVSVGVNLNSSADVKTAPLVAGTLVPVSPATVPPTYEAPAIESYSNMQPNAIYDSLGSVHTANYYFVKTAANTWDVLMTVDNGMNTGGAITAVTQLVFDENGKLTDPAGPPVGASAAVPIAWDMALGVAPQSLTFNFSQSTQFGSPFSVNQLEQDGYTSGRLTGVGVGADGMVLGSYSNGQSKEMGQVVLANFTNPNGLTSLGGNQWAETTSSGQALVGAPGTGTLGVLQSAAVEESNTDLTAELVNMITQQRNYQANAQSIKTQDQVMQTLVNLR